MFYHHSSLKFILAFFMGRLETSAALGREIISYKSLIPKNKLVPYQLPVPTAAVRFGLYSQVLQSILTSVNQTLWGNAPGHRIQNIYTSKAVGLVSQTIATYCCWVRKRRKNVRKQFLHSLPVLKAWRV